MKYYLFVLGCQMNKSDAEKIRFLLKKAGAKESDEKNANIIIALACSVRQKPIDRLWGKIKNWQKQNKKIFLTGCILASDRIKFSKKVDLIFKIDQIKNLPKWLNLKSNQKTAKDYLEIQSYYSSKNQAFVPIMTGCNNFCSYCAVPFCRGRERSRQSQKIIDEIKNLTKTEYKKIILLGQNVNSYKCPKTKIDFVKLLKKIILLAKNLKIEFITSHPKDFSDELIDLISKSEKISKSIHLPVQSGSDKILKKMNRKYTALDYLKLIKKLRTKIPKIKISTDIIVGFPGESKKDFEKTKDLTKKAKFSKAYIAMYSPRNHTSAFDFKDNVLPEEKKRRWRVLEKLINH